MGLLWGEEAEDDDDTNSYVMALDGTEIYMKKMGSGYWADLLAASARAW